MRWWRPKIENEHLNRDEGKLPVESVSPSWKKFWKLNWSGIEFWVRFQVKIPSFQDLDLNLNQLGDIQPSYIQPSYIQPSAAFLWISHSFSHETELTTYKLKS